MREHAVSAIFAQYDCHTQTITMLSVGLFKTTCFTAHLLAFLLMILQDFTMIIIRFIVDVYYFS